MSVFFVVMFSSYSHSHLLTEEWAVKTNLFRRSNYLIGCFFNKTITLVIGFMSMEANFIACGQGYSPDYTGKDGIKMGENFNSIKQIDELAFLTMADYEKALHNWNI